MNLEPNIWGPHYWATLHFISSTYDNNPNQSIKSNMKNFIQSLPVFLPCKECQDHAFDYIKQFNLNHVIQNRKELFTFFFNFHNNVNKRLKKPLMSMEDALNKYYIPIEEHHLYLPNEKKETVFGSKVINYGNKWNFIFIMVILFIIFFVRQR